MRALAADPRNPVALKNLGAIFGKESDSLREIAVRGLKARGPRVQPPQPVSYDPAGRYFRRRNSADAVCTIVLVPLHRDPLPEGPLQRQFYAEMARVERWSVRTLRQKIQGMLFERTAISRKPEELARQELEALPEGDRMTPDLVFRDPYLSEEPIFGGPFFRFFQPLCLMPLCLCAFLINIIIDVLSYLPRPKTAMSQNAATFEGALPAIFMGGMRDLGR
jgi:hypothetical protein